MKKTIVSLFFAALLGVATLTAQTGLAMAETITLKAITAWPKTASDNIPYQIFSEIVEQMVAKKYPGELKIQYIGGPEAVKTSDQVQALQRGMVDICYTTNAYYVSLLPEVDAMKLSPFSPEEERARGAWAYWKDLHEKKLKIYYLGRLGHDQKFYLYRGPLYNTEDVSGIMAEPPVVGAPYAVLVPQVDAYGNDVDGLRNVNVQVPLGTYTGWNIRKAGFSDGDSCDLTGAFIPFFKTAADRIAAGDSRPSLEERYATHADYVDAVTAAANGLVAKRLLLPQDAASIIAAAQAAAVP